MHRVADQCAFVRANCADEEAGLFSYLALYYCRLDHAHVLAFAILVLWLAMLFTTIGIAASDFFCINLSTIANILGMSESMAGVTFLALGNGSPDVFSTFAAMRTHSGSLAVGELIGAASFITSVVAGSMALIQPFEVPKRAFVRDLGFFTVAASFSMAFLYDGRLFLWECVVMIVFYVFYVCTVIVWHWWLGRRRRRGEEAVAAAASGVAEAGDGATSWSRGQRYTDGDVSAVSPGETSFLHQRGRSYDGYGALERAGTSPLIEPTEDVNEDQSRDRWLAELNDNMRISRPRRGERRPTLNPIRPSLVGALEFRAVLSSMQKSRPVQTMPANERRYTDDPNFTTAQQQQLDQASFVSDPEVASNFNSDLGASVEPNASGNRARAVSTNDVGSSRLGVDSFDHVPRLKVADQQPAPNSSLNSDASRSLRSSRSPSLSVSPPPSEGGSRGPSPGPPISRTSRASSSDLLAPPAPGYGGASRGKEHSPVTAPSPAADARPSEPSQRLTPQHLPRISLPQPPTPGHVPTSPFPDFTDSPMVLSAHASSLPPNLHLPPPSISLESYSADADEADGKSTAWWPHGVLPPPSVLWGTLFPTLHSWTEKSFWEKLLGIIAAPSVFLLAITLPVVESETDQDLPGSPTESYLTPRQDRARSRAASVVAAARMEGPLRGPADFPPDNSNRIEHRGKPLAGHTTRPQDLHGQSAAADEPRATDWGRWLVCLQTFTAPLFVVLVMWANSTPDSGSPQSLLLPCLYALLASSIALALLLLTTSATKAPRWRNLLCFLGFVVSVAWISTIANEVVGVLKAIGVILRISDAILGLTIFAVGNSLGDLVADVTVARLGLPVMALSACFGGPMLNILLGIGVSGLYMTVHNGVHHHAKHPHHRIRYKPYQIEVSSTLLISGATLLVTLAGLLVVVPLNGWRMDRKIGWGLMALWVISTLGNVLVEVTGWWALDG